MNKQEAILNEIAKWEWIAKTTRETNQMVINTYYFYYHLHVPYLEPLGSYVCYYAKTHYDPDVHGGADFCQCCPVEKWKREGCANIDSPSTQFAFAKTNEERIEACNRMIEVLKEELEAFMND